MANPRALDKRRKSVRNMRKITRTMELIATARFKQAMDRASAATSYTNQVSKLVSDLAGAGLEVSHPLLEGREETKRAKLLVLTANRGFCGGFVGNLVRAGVKRWADLQEVTPELTLEVSGKKGIGMFKSRGHSPDVEYMQFEDKPRYDQVEEIASRYLEEYITGKIDRLDVVYTRFESIARQSVAIETLLPLGSLAVAETADPAEQGANTSYEFLPSPESILEEVVPTSFKVKLFKCFLDSAVSEQIARMVAMKGATENAGDLIKQLSMQYNRARQGRITNELMDLIGGVEAIS
ncbi:ATP synthase gamma chain [Pseudobythopirellula maris]|uniref:ATP synthase gamma chain n=1 Tax=Pseudobythopirellula maris TaxID=2527991 RepID=A0A5C5ZRR5_9BACT|nr:ATP synthase F1 subunit gamma [Pseudobythopirellula maris]TWT89936.1 ATP synthase gamma chain [Pseudobythopirellula maris]